MNAYELSDALRTIESGWATDLTLQESVKMLRQQADRISELEKCVGFKDSGYDILIAHPKGKPLTDEEITQLIDELEPDIVDMVRFARAIEAKIRDDGI